MKTVRLPVDQNPIIATYSDIADLLCILGSNRWKREWILCHYTQILYMDSPDGSAVFSFCSPIYECSLVDWEKITSLETVSALQAMDLLRRRLQGGDYCIITVNMRYVPNAYAYGKWDEMHRVMLYGYDDLRGVFHAMIHRSHYITTEISYDQFQMGYHPPREDAPIYFARNNTSGFPIHWTHILNDFRCYAEGNAIMLDGKPAYYGLLAVEKLLALVKQNRWDLRKFSTYREHKDVLLWKTARLMELGVAFCDPNVLEKLREIQAMAKICEMLCMKRVLTKADAIPRRISALIGEITRRERVLIPQLAQGVEDYMTRHQTGSISGFFPS